jgi:altronate hydrolase
LPSSRNPSLTRTNWDDSGTAQGEALHPAEQAAGTALVLDGSVDNVAVAMEELHVGEDVPTDGGAVTVTETVPAGHKVAIQHIGAGDPVVKLGHEIGRAASSISPGQHVHVHNVRMPTDTERVVHRLGGRAAPAWKPPATPTRDHFLGYRRPDGRVGTRNYIAVLPSVNCSATVARMIAQTANARFLDTPGFDGVVALGHDLGCAMAQGTAGDEILRRTLQGYATHVNFAAVLVVGLGCEVNQPENFLVGSAADVERIGIQELGGTSATIEAGVRWIESIAGTLASAQREQVGFEELTLGLQCGGSDAASGITANPTLGVAADLLVAAGGRVVLGETPEIFGAEHLLRARTDDRQLARQIDELIAWWISYSELNGVTLDNNPSKGNRDGGITTIWEKSLGALLKGGTSPLRSVVQYAEQVREPGLTFMDTPGYDPVSATGMIAGGANVLAFTTGRGSVFGSRPTPCLKIASTTSLYEHMIGDMDFDAGPALTRTTQIELGTRLFEAIVDMASGAASKSEAIGFGAEEIAPWRVGAVL